jgi:hypothetical protein
VRDACLILERILLPLVLPVPPTNTWHDMVPRERAILERLRAELAIGAEDARALERDVRGDDLATAT